MLQESPKLEQFEIEENINITLSNEPSNGIIWYLGEDIPDHIESLDNGLFELISINSVDQLMHFLKNPPNRKLPEAILISDFYINSLKSAGFSDLKKKSGFGPVALIIFSIADNVIDNRTSSVLGIDGCFSTKIKLNDLIFKIEFSRKLRRLNRTINDEKNEIKNNYHDLLLKRVFDIVFSGTALIILSPILLIIAILIKLESSGPIFYISQRAGTNYKIFDFYKFRTMVKDADKKLKELSDRNQYQKSDGNADVFYKIQNDPRVTRLGKFLRNTSLDELPQLLNILKGDMSIVGNRPLPLYEAERLTVDEYAERFLAPSGLTGLWQVKKRGTDEVTNEERIELDKAYARKRSFLFDLKLIIKTLPVFIQKESV